MFEKVINIMIPRFIARKPLVRTGTYNKFGFVITLHQYCICPRCKSTLNAGPNYQPQYCDKCGQKLNCSDVVWTKEKELGYAERSEAYEPVQNRVV